jgi:hypothetical protein
MPPDRSVDQLTARSGPRRRRRSLDHGQFLGGQVGIPAQLLQHAMVNSG